ncbi:energy-coupling factor ABC transporter permease [Effusibacillus lacus]|uniref:Cobalamin biosynthesis protein CbiM n=1 Tax=Effusibacillus lacus TaxID=1348429 RepID=A0A292YD67_9BACL|nr:energy-coupling factor ABC transporter permease [Effusibacillus lacus]TCS71226.1 cobalt/nickel transport system permease protein [Effusibacillus lacus]GAX89852.1 cobalamin biosynthesis protein CbiM [Effusibacillus lacus]
MHIPDGFLDTRTWMTLTAVSAVGVSLALKKAKLAMDESRVPLIGITAAFIFASQMINFPVAGATSGHLNGATLAAILFGPWVSVLVMTTVTFIQTLFFQDGGITALGANLFNLGMLTSFIGYGLYRPFAGVRNRNVKLLGVFAASWTAVVVSSAGVAVELALSGTAPLVPAMKAMIGWHSLIGIGEGIVTVTLLRYLMERKTSWNPLLSVNREG